jgi:hypothetical protein
MLSDDVFLDIFDFYRNISESPRLVWEWHLLVHVCRRWRQIIFESPHRLNLQILCTHRTPVRENLGIWPAFPIAIEYNNSGWDIPPSSDEDIVIVALEHRDRVSRIMLNATGSQLAKMVTVMQGPFPVLTHLEFGSSDGEAPILSDGFLGGSAPCLQELRIDGIPFPKLPTLLLSTSDLITLTLLIPPFGYISPEAIVVALASLPKLETLNIELLSDFSHHHRNRMRSPHTTRTVLPALATFTFMGACEYLEDLVTQIDSPQLDRIDVYLNYPVDVPFTQLSKFIDRSVGPKLTLFKHAQLKFHGDFTNFIMSRHANFDWDRESRTIISCDGHSRHIAELLGQFSATEILSNVVHLKLEGQPQEVGTLEADGVEWLHILRQFSAVQTLHVSQVLAGYVAVALEDFTGNSETVTELLPSLNLIRLAGQSASSIGRFVAARGLADRPVTAVDTITEFNERLQSSVSN